MIHNKRGFTIVEVMVVILVIGVLAAILIPSFANVGSKSASEDALNDAKNTILEYKTQNDSGLVNETVIFVKSDGVIFIFAYNLREGVMMKADKLLPNHGDTDMTNSAVALSAIQADTTIVHDDYYTLTLTAEGGYNDLKTKIEKPEKNVLIYEGTFKRDSGHFVQAEQNVLPEGIGVVEEFITTFQNADGSEVATFKTTEGSTYTVPNENADHIYWQLISYEEDGVRTAMSTPAYELVAGRQFTLSSANVVYRAVLNTNPDPKTEVDATSGETWYLVHNLKELQWFQKKVHDGAGDGTNLVNLNIRLMRDIAINKEVFTAEGTPVTGAKGWTPIGYATTNMFSGKFDGNGNTISGLYTESAEANNPMTEIGLFSAVSGAEISNLTIDNSYFKGSNYVGAIAGKVSLAAAPNPTKIQNCVIGKNVKIISVSPALENYVTPEPDPTATPSPAPAAESYSVGGVVGGVIAPLTNPDDTVATSEKLTIANCTYRGNISGSRYLHNVGGMIGSVEENAEAEVSSCVNDGVITAGQINNTTTNAGGIVGYVNGKILVTGSSLNGAVNYLYNNTINVGGIIGNVGMKCSSARLQSCAITEYGKVNGYNNVGGMVGQANRSITISGCINNGEVKANNAYSGGIIANASSLKEDITGPDGVATPTPSELALSITNCVNNGRVTSSGGVAGGIIGVINEDVVSATITGCKNNQSANVSGKNNVGGILGDGRMTGTDTSVTEPTTGELIPVLFVGIQIEKSYNGGTIKADTNNAGGIFGIISKNATVSGCYNFGYVSANNNVGGIGGFMNVETTANSKISRTYNVGIVTFSGAVMATSQYGPILGGVTETEGLTPGAKEAVLPTFEYTYYLNNCCVIPSDSPEGVTPIVNNYPMNGGKTPELFADGTATNPSSVVNALNTAIPLNPEDNTPGANIYTMPTANTVYSSTMTEAAKAAMLTLPTMIPTLV